MYESAVGLGQCLSHEQEVQYDSSSVRVSVPCMCRFAKEHQGQFDWVRKNEGHKGVQVMPSLELLRFSCSLYV